LKGGDDPAVNQAIAAILSHAESSDARRVVQNIIRQQRSLVERLGETPSDPRPLPSTAYATEAKAVMGLATPPDGLRLLYAVIRVTSPDRVVEIGGAHGFSAILMDAAMKDAGITAGTILTLEGMTVRARIASDLATRTGASFVQVIEGLFEDTLAPALEPSPALVFSDGDKGVDLTRWHSRAALDAVRSRGGWLFFDDIAYSPEIRDVFSQIVQDDHVRWAVAFRDRWALLRVSDSPVTYP
jgi:predicted O-methyltransferase YrrM